MKRKLALMVIVVLVVALLIVKVAGEKMETVNYGTVSVHKMLTIKFDRNLDAASVNKDTVYVKDSKGDKIDVEVNLIMDDRWITAAPKTRYEADEAYTLVVTRKVKDAQGRRLKHGRAIQFTTSDSIKDKLVLGWNYIHDKEDNTRYYDDPGDFIRQRSEKMGVGIVSPTWFDIRWENKKFKEVVEKIDPQYLATARENGYEVWPCFQMLSDSSVFDSINDYANHVNEMLTDEATVDAIITSVVNYSRQYGLKGINMDFEAMGKTNRDPYTAFMKKLYQELHKHGIVVSVDVTVPVSNSMYSVCYDRPELINYVDYMMFMAYDEHYASSEAGSVGSYGWVEEGIKKFLSAGIPPEKLVLGVPFYMRDYAVIEANPDFDAVVVTKMESGSVPPKLYGQPSRDGEALKSCLFGDTFECLSIQENWYQVGYEGKNAYIEARSVKPVKADEKKKFTVGSSVKNATYIEKILNDKEAEAIFCYDSEARQDVLVYYQYDSTKSVKLKHEIWLENKKSMTWRVQLAEKYDLKGIAAWQLSHDIDEILDVLKVYNKK